MRHDTHQAMHWTTKVIIGLSVLIVGLVFARIIVSSAFSVDGITMADMQGKIAFLDKENMILREKIYTHASYAHVASDAAVLGFVEEKSQLSLSGASSIAIRQ